MKIKKMTLYAAQIVERMYLEGEGVITSKSISESEDIPQGVVMKILLKLKHAGIVDSHQGRGVISGGYTLAKSVRKLTLYDVFMAMEAEICLYSSYRDQDYGKDFEVIYNELIRVNNAFIKELKKYTLYELIEERSKVAAEVDEVAVSLN